MSKLIIPLGYSSILEVRETEIAIKKIKDFFENELARNLNLTRVSAPLFVKPETGLNDNLNGVERPVQFGIREQNDAICEIIHSLAKWKRMALKRYGFCEGEGLYTDMNAIRRDEDTDNLHSIYVDQWDWEKIISTDERNFETLFDTVRKIYSVIKATEDYITSIYSGLKPYLPDDIHFITTQEMEDMYPDLCARDRENEITRKYGAVFIIGIGGALKSGQKHDDRAPDYDDWNLNGDILLFNPILDIAVEVSSMGIRVNRESLKRQLEICNCTERAELTFHKALLNNELPQTMGGGIGQSRICLMFLQKAHIGEVQSSIWPDQMVAECEKANIKLL
jgi:aspartate--ammonia ligase